MSSPIQHSSAVLVDTNAFQRKLLRSLLRGSGFQRLMEADCLDTALDEASRSYPDFIFIDYDTAKRSELMRGSHNIRQKYLKGGTHIIFLLHNATRPRVDDAIASGANWVLCRPFSPKSLDRRIRAVMDPGSCIQIDQILPQQKKLPQKTQEGPSTESQNMSKLVHQMDTLLKQSRHYQDAEPEEIRTPKNKQDEAEEDIFLL